LSGDLDICLNDASIYPPAMIIMDSITLQFVFVQNGDFPFDMRARLGILISVHFKAVLIIFHDFLCFRILPSLKAFFENGEIN